MPSAFYTISFKATASVLALCSFEKQSPADQAAWDKLRDALVGDKLRVGLGTAPNFELPASFLAVDEVSGTPPDESLTNPYAFGLTLASATSFASDGVAKPVQLASDNTYASATKDNNAKTLTVTLALNAPADVPAWLLYESLAPVPGTIDTTTNPKKVVFRLPTTVSITAGDEFLFLMQGVPTTRDEV